MDAHMQWAQRTAAENNAAARDELVLRLFDKLDREIAELRTLVDDLDHSTVKRPAFDELHTRVDDLTASYDAHVHAA